MTTAIIGLIGVILGSILAGLKDWLMHFFQRKSNGRYAAVRIIALLEEYAQECVSVVSDDGTSYGRPAGRTEQGEEYYTPQVATPKPPIFAEDIDWKSISFELMYRILALPNAARETDRYIMASAEHSFLPNYEEVFDARQEGYAHLGLQSIHLIKELQKEFKFPEAPAKFWDWGWDMEDFFQENLRKFQTRRQKMVADEDKV